MEVSSSSEIGISPVLLQAINQLSNSKKQVLQGLGQQVVITGADNQPKLIKVESSSEKQASNSASNLPPDCQVIQTPTGQTLVIMSQASLPHQELQQPRMITINPTATAEHPSDLGKVVIKNVSPSQVVGSNVSKIAPKPALLSPKINNSHHGEGDVVISPKIDPKDMGGMLSAIASHVARSQIKSEDSNGHSSGIPSLSSSSVAAGDADSHIKNNCVSIRQQLAEVFPPPAKKSKTSPVILRGSSATPTNLTMTTSASGSSELLGPLSLVHGSTSQPGMKPALSPTSPVSVTTPPVSIGQQRMIDYPVILEDGSQVIVQQLHNIDPVETTVETVSDSTTLMTTSSLTEIKQPHIPTTGIPMSALTVCTTTPDSYVQVVGPASSQSSIDSPCPICGDRISGYHYGIFTCESCKGFFKRTVQNKKAFICHRKGECEVGILNRKKCPSCRFKRCLQAGMKLEAVREDRQRGGRSSYEGAQHSTGKAKLTTTTTTPKRILIKPSPQQMPVKRTILLPSPSGGNQMITMVYPDEGSRSVVIQPHTPQLLQDLMTVEALMNEEEGEQECCHGKFQDGDDNMFASLLHLADHCLYKIVRWARNLPEFAHVSTDDQILLLQNSWGELLCMCCCWNSIRSFDALKLINGRMLDMDRAKEMDITEVTQRLIHFSALLRTLELDQYEYAALKVMLLLNPDVKNLQDPGLIRQHQENVLECLMIYTATHFPYKPNKFCEILARIAELSRSCIQAKDILKQRQSLGDIPQYSLLSELLKGDAVVQST